MITDASCGLCRTITAIMLTCKNSVTRGKMSKYTTEQIQLIAALVDRAAKYLIHEAFVIRRFY